MRSGSGIDQDEPESVFEALRDEEFCGRKREEIPAPVLADISVCGFDFAYAYRIEIGLDLDALRVYTLFCDLEYVKCPCVAGITPCCAFNEEILSLFWRRNEKPLARSLKYLAGLVCRLAPT